MLGTLADLCDALHTYLGKDGSLATHDPAVIMDLMQQYTSNEADWHKFAHFDSWKYTRNLVDAGNGCFNLMILCWGPGQASAIHDHSGAHCVMKVLSGQLCETLYEWPRSLCQSDKALDVPMRLDSEEAPFSATTSMSVRGSAVLQRNQITYIHDSIGLHRVSNPSLQEPAVSLHLYTPPFDECRTYCERTGHARASGVCSYFSIDGKRTVFPHVTPKIMPATAH